MIRRAAYNLAVQIVGRECDTCRAVLKTEGGAIGCERCELAFHKACLADRAGKTYRDAASSTGKTAKQAPLHCPRCDDDLRARKRERDAERDRIHAQAEERRAAQRVARGPEGGSDRRSRAILWIALGITLLLLRALIRLGD